MDGQRILEQEAATLAMICAVLRSSAEAMIAGAQRS